MTVTNTAPPTIQATDAPPFADRLFAAVLGAQEVQAVALGHRLGWYRRLAEEGPLRACALAAATGTDERYAREWLEHQAVCGYLVVEDLGAAPDRRRFALPAEHAEVLVDQDSTDFVAPLAWFVAGVGEHLGAIADAYRTGGGVSWSALGPHVSEAQAAANRPMFLHQLGQELLPQAPDVQARLRAGARVADIGTGHGWSAIGLARSYPDITVDGFDLDSPSIDAARRNAVAAGVEDRVRFHHGDAAALPAPQPHYDVVFAFECIHDLADPVAVLATMGEMAGEEGVVVVMDENVAAEFHAPGDDVERLMYGYSITCCLPDGRSHDHSAATGTVMRQHTLESYAADAGFSEVSILPIEHGFFRFSRLHP